MTGRARSLRAKHEGGHAEIYRYMFETSGWILPFATLAKIETFLKSDSAVEVCRLCRRLDAIEKEINELLARADAELGIKDWEEFADVMRDFGGGNDLVVSLIEEHCAIEGNIEDELTVPFGQRHEPQSAADGHHHHAVAREAGASVRFEQRVSGYISAEFTLNGRRGKVFFAGLSSDRNAYENAQRAAKRNLDELKDGLPKQEQIK